MSDENIKPIEAFTTSFTLSSMASGHPGTLNASANFVQSSETDGSNPAELTVLVNFPYKNDLTASATFYLSLYQSLLVTVSLGTHIKNFPLSVSFNAAGQTSFPCKMTIQSLVITQAGNYGGLADFKGKIQISALGSTTLAGTVNYRQPPIDQDLLSVVTFINSFTIVAIDDNGNIYPGTIDATGYFIINDLPAGQYTVIPSYTNIYFYPYQIITQVGPNNSFIYFNTSNSSFLSFYNQENPACYINANQGQAGTYSIEGLILAPNNNYRPILAVITDPTIETNYKQTLNKNSSYGVG
jgi:hypothetical protein